MGLEFLDKENGDTLFPTESPLNDKLLAAARLWNFGVGSARVIQEDHLVILAIVADFIKDNPGCFCAIFGLASRAGRSERNLFHSENRARSVLLRLVVHHGVALQRFLWKPTGQSSFARGEEAWGFVGVKDTNVENRFHRLVALQIWKDNDPSIIDLDRQLTKQLRGQAKKK